MADGAGHEWQDVPVRWAATVLPLRDGDAGLEVCLLRRNGNSTWVAGLALFPGGAVDERDDTPQIAARCVVSSSHGPLDGGLGPWVAALRECYEEIGLLLADDPHGQPAHADPHRAAQLHAARAAVDSGTLDLADLLAAHALQLRVDQMRFIAHWVTPPGQARRYDTRFYIVPTPPDAPIAPDGTEIVSADWISPQAAIDAHERGELPMLPPTLGALHWLAPHGRVADAILAADALGTIPRWTPGDIDAAARRAARDPTGPA